jgi:HEAT repeat protein
MKRVFISYCHEDGDFADTLRRRLDDEGIPTWQDTDLRGGEQWRIEIDLAIREALAAIVVLSPEAVRSDYVAYEWAFALGAGVNVIPVVLRVGFEALHPALQARNYLDFSNRLARPWELLFRAVKGTGAPALNTTVRIPPGAPPVLEQAVRSLDSMDKNEREAALDTLEGMEHEAVVEVLAGAVTHPIAEVRFRAAGMLLSHGDRRALPAVFEALRTGWSFSFEKLDRDALPDLLAALGDRDSDVRGSVATAVGRMLDPTTIPTLKRLLDDESPSVRRCAVDALGGFRDGSLLPAFREAFLRKDGSESYALRAAAGLPGGEDLLIEALDHPDSSVRQTALEILSTTATPAALKPLCRATKDREIYIRRQAVLTLGVLRNPQAIETLGEALDDEEQSVRQAAREALAKIGGPAVVAFVLDALRSPTRIYREEAARLVGELGEAALVPLLIETLGDETADEKVRVAIVESLAKLSGPGSPAVSALTGLLSESGLTVPIAAVRALGSIADPASVGPLGAVLNEGTSDFRKLVLDALRNIGTPEARRLVAMRKR